jgi:hypothetical protein
VKYVIACLLALIAVLNFYRAWTGYRRGSAEWFAGRNLAFAADRDDDPVAFNTAVWGNAAAGALTLWIAGWTVFG